MKYLFSLTCLLVCGVPIWVAADMRYLLRLSQRKNQLEIDGKWDELEKHFKQTIKVYHPFAWLQRRYVLPGADIAQFGLFLFQRGRLEEALSKVNLAISQIESKSPIFRTINRRRTEKIYHAALASRILILGSMGRYDEARETSDRLRKISGSTIPSNAALALVEINSGHLDEGLELAKSVPPEHHQYESMRGLMARAYTLKGEFAQAVEAMVFEAAGISKFYSPEGLEMMMRSSDGFKLFALQSQKHGGIFPPGRFLRLANVYLEQGAFDRADIALDEAEKSLGSNQVLQISYWSARSRSYAGQGNPAEAEKCIARVCEMTKQLNSRSTTCESHLAIGRSNFALQRFAEALTELTEALRYSLHPIEKHQIYHWMARTYEASGNSTEAISNYQEGCLGSNPELDAPPCQRSSE